MLLLSFLISFIMNGIIPNRLQAAYSFINFVYSCFQSAFWFYWRKLIMKRSSVLPNYKLQVMNYETKFGVANYKL